ncbi:alginate export family protein [Thermithiobacillus tepidarius DSM 3134]|uniref:alginate export family protein n=1 Tax=Thermithiobacillus tepidarius TaxID=929 RepID=UPI000403EFE3|nr:alginate export family protein [Thermithiobacillus tepidarius]
MRKPHPLSLSAALLLALNLSAPAASADVLSDAISGGKVSLQLRPRYEFVNQDGKTENAQAFTMRTLLGYSTRPVAGLGATLQLSNVTHLANDAFFDGSNGKTQYPTVADAERTAVNQALLSYTGLPQTTLKLGRQIITLDNHRFIGNVDWRQNMQTFDGVSLENKSLAGVTLYAAYLTRVHASYAHFQPPVGQNENLQPVRLTLLRAGIEPVKGTTLAGFGYFYDDRTKADGAANNLSNGITGLRLDGGYPLGGVKALYTAEYAKQLAYAGGRAGLNTDYWHLGAGLSWPQFHNISARFDYEVLGTNANATYGFQTPLATRHAFNGWADLFLTTPGNGLRDLFATLGATVAKAQLSMVYHDYRSDAGDVRFGSEIDFLATYPLMQRLTLGAKYADYRADEQAGVNFPGTAQANVDIQKTWVFMTYNY